MLHDIDERRRHYVLEWIWYVVQSHSREPIHLHTFSTGTHNVSLWTDITEDKCADQVHVMDDRSIWTSPRSSKARFRCTPYAQGEQFRVVRVLTDEPYRLNLEYDDLIVSLRDELSQEYDVNTEELSWTSLRKASSNSAIRETPKNNPFPFDFPTSLREKIKFSFFASDTYENMQNVRVVWCDRIVENVCVSSAKQSLRHIKRYEGTTSYLFSGDDTFFMFDSTDISPSSMPQLTVATWVYFEQDVPSWSGQFVGSPTSPRGIWIDTETSVTVQLPNNRTKRV